MDWATADYTQVYGDTFYTQPPGAGEGIYLLDEANRGEDPATDSPPRTPHQPYARWDRPGLEAMPWSWQGPGRPAPCHQTRGLRQPLNHSTKPFGQTNTSGSS